MFKRIKPHYRQNYKTRHPSYMYAYDEKQNKYVYIGLTHSPITDGMHNILVVNPNPKDKEKAYFRPMAKVEQEKMFSKYVYPWKNPKTNEEIAQKIVNQSNKKRRNSR